MLDIATSLSSGDSTDSETTATRLLIQFVPVLLLSTIGAVAATIAVMDLLAGRRPSLSRCFEPIGERFWPLVATLVVIAVAVVGVPVVAALALPLVAVLLLLLGSLYLLVIWLFAPQAAVIERRSAREALERSRLLVAGGWLQVFATFLVIQLVALVVQVALARLAVPAQALSHDREVILVGSWAVVVATVIQPFVLIGVALLYLDRRVRRDGGWQPLPERRSGDPLY